MLTRLQRIFLRTTRTLWFRATVFSLVAVVVALVAKAVDRYVPDDVGVDVGAGAVEAILSVLASSLLAVTIFSLNTISAALAAATQHTSPRATRLLMEDFTSQNALATFLGAFMFSLVGIIALNVGYYGERGRLVLLVATLGVVAVVVVTLLRWIDHVTHLGRVGRIASHVEATTRGVLEELVRRPWLGGRMLDAAAPALEHAVVANRIGYVQHVDVRALEDLAAEAGGDVQVVVRPGDFIDPARELARVSGTWGEAGIDALRRAITIEEERSFDQDPVFGLQVLGEIGSRALSPAMNDPGTAIDVIGRAVRLLCTHARAGVREVPAVGRVYVRGFDESALVRAVFEPLLRDGAGRIDVALRLQAALRSIADCGSEPMRRTARGLSRLGQDAAARALPLPEDRNRLADAAGWSAPTPEVARGGATD